LEKISLTCPGLNENKAKEFFFLFLTFIFLTEKLKLNTFKLYFKANVHQTSVIWLYPLFNDSFFLNLKTSVLDFQLPCTDLDCCSLGLLILEGQSPDCWVFLDQHSPVELSASDSAEKEHFYLMQYPLTTYGYWAFEMGLVWLRNYILTLFSSDINGHMCS